MQQNKIFAAGSIAIVIILMLFVYPSTDNLINAGQSKYKQEVPTFTNAYQIAVPSNNVIAHYFGKDVVDKIMKQPGCVGVRMYYGKKENGKSGIIFFGVDKNGKECSTVNIAGPTIFCPPICND